MKELSSVLRDDLGLKNTPRLKTKHTLIDKLVREQSNLFTMDDIAGLRLEPVTDRVIQDQVCRLIVSRFPPPDSRVKDRRERPNAGYRAVHVIVKQGIYRVEVQIRTHLQHQWAEANEKLADIAGRSLRYGIAPANPHLRELHERILAIAEVVNSYEETEVDLQRLKNPIDRIDERLPWSPSEVLVGRPGGLAEIEPLWVTLRGGLQEQLDLLRQAVVSYEAMSKGTRSK